ncbi:MAG: GntR family transcriptional regulator [Treponema sp.]|nr:GntR family transcriptional regulator [Treponema sp.]
MPNKDNKLSVYESLRYEILNLIYKPGENLDINKLAEKLSVSRSPVRDALLRLSLDKLVDIFPQKGTRVSLLNKDIFWQERFMRINLELALLEKCMSSLTNEEEREIFTTKMNGQILSQHASLMAGDSVSFLKHDDEMHHLLYSQAKCEWVWETLLSRTGNDSRIRILSFKKREIPEIVEKEHKELVEAIRQGNFEKAKEIDYSHLTRLYKEIEELENDFPEYFE